MYYALIITDTGGEELLDEEWGPFEIREQAVRALVAVLQAKEENWFATHTEDYIRNNENQYGDAIAELECGNRRVGTDENDYEIIEL